MKKHRNVTSNKHQFACIYGFEIKMFQMNTKVNLLVKSNYVEDKFKVEELKVMKNYA